MKADVSDVGTVKKKTRAPTTRLTLEWYRKQGYVCDISERFNAFANVRNDLLGFCDIVAVNEDEVLFIQTTSRSNLSSRRNKIRDNRAANLLSELPGARVVLVGWYKDGHRWKCVEETYRMLCHGYICSACAAGLGAVWPEGHVATMFSGRCPQCREEKVLASVGDYNWPDRTKKPRLDAGRD